MKKKYLIYLICAVILLTASLIEILRKETVHPRDYEEILQSGVLKAVTEYNAISYHVSADTVTGFHYEILKAFAHDKGLKLEVTPEMSFEKRLLDVEKGKYDILGNNNVIISELKDSLLFTNPIILNKQILIQRKREIAGDSVFIDSQLKLAHKTINVVKGSPAIIRIKNLSNEIGDTIYVNEIDKYGQEQLLAMVAYGDIDYAVCDEGIARASVKDMPQLDISTPISFTQFYSWGINKQSPALLDTINVWLNHYITTPEFKKLRLKYYNK